MPFSKSGPCLTNEELARYRSEEGPDRDRMDRHLAGCMECVALLPTLPQGEQEEEVPSQALLRRVESLPARMAYRRSRRAPVRPPQSSLFPFAIAAGLLLALGVGLLFRTFSAPAETPVHVMNPSEEEEKRSLAPDIPESTVVIGPGKDSEEVLPKENPTPIPPEKEPELIPEPEPELKPENIPDREETESPEKVIPPEPKEAPVPERPTIVTVHLSEVQGTLLCNGKPVSSGSNVAFGDRLQTPFGSEARVRFAGGVIWLDHKTEIQLDPDLLVHLSFGKIYVQSAPGIGIATPAGTVRPQGTEFQVETDLEGTTSVVVQTGRVRFENNWGGRNIAAGMRSTGRAGRRPGPSLHVKNLENLFAWVQGVKTLFDSEEKAFVRLYPAGKKPSLILSAPHVPIETKSKEMAGFLAEKLDVPLIVGNGFKGPRGIDLNEPGKSEKSRSAFLSYVEVLRESGRGLPLPFLVEIHSYGVKDGKTPVIEISTAGFRRSELEKIKAKYEELVQKVNPKVRAQLRFDLTDPTYEVDGEKRPFKYKSEVLRRSGVFRKTVSSRGWKVNLPWEVRYTGEQHYRTILLELLREVLR